MTQGKPSIAIAVVPDSGTGELARITGAIKINIAADGKHTHDFDYELSN